jgi:5,10-methylenetetrahydromethanopterin reductase
LNRGEVGLGVHGNQSPEEYAKLAQRAERYGFDVFSVFSDLGYQPAIVPHTTARACGLDPLA